MKNEVDFMQCFKIWFIHVVVYYLVFGSILQSLSQWYKGWELDLDFFGTILLSPIVAILGLFDGFPLYFLFPLVLFLVLNKLVKVDIFRSYLISVILFYLFIKFFIYIYNDYPFKFSISSNQKDDDFEPSLLFGIIPSLLASSFFVKLYLKKALLK